MILKKISPGLSAEPYGGLSFGKVLQKYRKQAKLSQPDLAQKMQVTRNTITNWETDKNSPSIEQTVALCRLLGMSANELLGTPGEAFRTDAERRLVVHFRQLSRVSQKVVCGLVEGLAREEEAARLDELRESHIVLALYSSPLAAGTGIEADNEPPEYVFARRTAANSKADAIARVSGRSMEPLYHDGDLLYIQYTDAVDDGEDAACSTEDGLVVKRCKDHKLYSLNADYPFGDKPEDFSVKMLGRVLGVVAPGEIADSSESSDLEEALTEEVKEFKVRYGVD